jgi:hypothetical protein
MITIIKLEDIERLIDAQIEENVTLDYKKDLGDNKNIAKDICAFANTEGGTIIYGVNSQDRIPISLNWIETENVEEKIQNIVATSIYPKPEGVRVLKFSNRDNEKQAVYAVEVSKSLDAPHMFDNRYYKRRGSISFPMDHNEVKNAMFGSGRNAALRFEISANIDLLDTTYSLFESLLAIVPERRQRVALVPFHTDAWNSVISSGLLFAFSENTLKQLVEAYAIIHEINSLIDWLRIGREMIVHTTAYRDSFKEHGTYVPSIIQNKLGKLRSLLQQLSEGLESM